MNRRYYYIFLLFSLPFFGRSQDIKVSARLKQDTLKIGEQTTLTLEAQGKPDQKVYFPQIGDTLTSAIEVLETSEIDSVKQTSTHIYRKTITITIFDTGHYSIPPFQFISETQDKIDTLETAPLSLDILTIQVDTTLPVKDIKPIATLPAPPPDYSWMWWLLLLIPIAGIIYYLLKRKKKKIPAPEVKEPPKSAHVKALEALDLLEKEQLWQKDQSKNYHSRLTEIVRTYIEERFDIPALEQTSREILSMMKRSGTIKEEDYEKLDQLLILADMVKFARITPLAKENELSLRNARNFIQNTTRKKQESSEEL